MNRLIQEDLALEPHAIENEIRLKARELAEDYGADFVAELAGDYLGEAGQRVARLRQALSVGDAAAVSYEAHTLKSSSANLGAQTFAEFAKRFEEASRNGDLALVLAEVESFERQFAAVQASLAALQSGPEQFLAAER